MSDQRRQKSNYPANVQLVRQLGRGLYLQIIIWVFLVEIVGRVGLVDDFAALRLALQREY